MDRKVLINHLEQRLAVLKQEEAEAQRIKKLPRPERRAEILKRGFVSPGIREQTVQEWGGGSIRYVVEVCFNSKEDAEEFHNCCGG